MKMRDGSFCASGPGGLGKPGVGMGRPGPDAPRSSEVGTGVSGGPELLLWVGSCCASVEDSPQTCCLAQASLTCRSTVSCQGCPCQSPSYEQGVTDLGNSVSAGAVGTGATGAMAAVPWGGGTMPHRRCWQSG